MTGKKKYIKLLNSLIYFKGSKERKFIHDMENDINEYLSSNPDATYNELIQEFGTPWENFSSYLQNQTSEYLLKRIKIKNIIYSFLFISIVFVILIFGSLSYYWNRIYRETLESNIYGFQNEIEVLDEGMQK